MTAARLISYNSWGGRPSRGYMVHGGQITLVPVEEAPIDQVLDVLSQSFGRPFTADWYAWKHRDGPWGPSVGCAAMDDAGVAGVRLLLPWSLRHDSETVTALRAVEASTAPRVRGRGVFRSMNEQEMRRIASEDAWRFIFSTANEQSRPAYVRLGWSALPPINHAYRPTLPSLWGAAEELDVGTAPLLAETSSAPGRIRTDWTADALRWRFDARSGHEYAMLRLRNASVSNGLVYRRTTRRVPTLLPLIVWGGAGERRALLGAAARRTRAPVALEPVGPGAESLSRGPVLRRGQSHLAVWPNSPEAAPWPVLEIARWQLSMTDLESVL